GRLQGAAMCPAAAWEEMRWRQRTRRFAYNVVAVCGDDDGRYLNAVVLQVQQQFEAGHLRHLQVDDQTRGRSLVDRREKFPRRRRGFCVKRAYAQQPGQGFPHARVVVNNGDPTGSLYHRLKIIVTGEIAIEVDLGPMATF